MNICPNKSGKEYQDLVKFFGGSEAKAFQAWYKHNTAKPGDQYEIPIMTGDPLELSEFNADLTHPDITMTRDKVARKIYHNYALIYTGNNFSRYRDEPMPGDQVNPETGKIYTYDEWLTFNVTMYEKRHAELTEIQENIDKPDYLKNLSIEELRALNIRLENNFNIANGLLRDEFGWPFVTVRVEYHSRLVAAILKKHTDAGHDVSAIRHNDADVLDLSVTAITDFGADKPEMQALGILTQRHFAKAEKEAQQTLSNLNAKMKAVIGATYAHKGNEWLAKLNLFVDNTYMKKAFEWMIEKDAAGQPTGNFISRYEEREEEMLNDAFRKDWNEHVQAMTYVIRREQIMRELVKGKPSTFLAPAEHKELVAIINRFKTVYGKGYPSLTSAEQREYSADTHKMRRFWAKMKVKENDSEFFVNLKSIIASNPESPEAKVAKAQIEFYDFIYDKSSELMFHNKNMEYSLERAIMPQVGIQTLEAFHRAKHKSLKDKVVNGFKAVFSVFFREENIDTANLQTHDGLLVSKVNFASFKTSSKVPLRTISPIKDFAKNGSTDIYSILRYHFANQINAKNLSPLLSDFHAVYAGLEAEGIDANNKEFKNSKEYIEQFAEQFILSKTADWERSNIGKAAALLKNISIIQFLGFNPATSMINLMQGLSEDMKMMVGKYGYEKGTKMIGAGFNRMFGTEMSNMDTIGFDKKAFAILEYYGIETFTKSEIDQFNSWAGKIQDVALIMQSKGESIIWGVGLLGQMTQEEWDNFYLDPNGALMIRNTKLITKYSSLLDLHPMFEQKYNLGSVQGKYFVGGRRPTKNQAILHNAMPFKGWLWDYLRSRFQSQKINMFSKKEEGYYRGAFALGGRKLHAMFSSHERAAQALSGQDKFTELDRQNLRMISYDVLMGSILFLLHSAAGSEDRKESPYEKFIAKIASQMYLFLYMEQMIKLVKQPFATLHDIEMGAKFLQGAIEADPEKMGKAMYGILPRLGKDAVDAAMEEENERE